MRIFSQEKWHTLNLLQNKREKSIVKLCLILEKYANFSTINY